MTTTAPGPRPGPGPRLRGAGLARAAVLVTGLTAVSSVLGFVRDAVIAAVYGADLAVDAYLVAQGLMNLVLGLVTSAVAKATVPTVARAVADRDPQRGHRSVRVALTLTVAVLVVASAGMFAAAPTVVSVLAPGFGPEASALAVEQTRIVLLATVFIAGTNILAATAQASGRFFWSGLQGLPFNLIMIAGAALLGSAYGIVVLAWAFVLGSAARLAVQLPAIRAIGLRLRPSLAVRDAGFRELVTLVPPLLIGSAVTNVNLLVMRAIGSAQGEGTIAALNYGHRLVNLADTLLVAAVVAALYPALGAAGGRASRADLRSLTGRSMRVTIVLLGPVVVMMVLAARPMVELLFGRGDFDDRAVTLTSSAVVAFALTVLAAGLRELLSRAFYAVGDSRTPVAIAVLGMGVNVIGGLTVGAAYGVPGLAGSTSAAGLVVVLLLLLALHRRHDGIDLPTVAATLLRVAAAGAAAAVPTAVVLALLPWPAGSLGTLGALGVAGVACLGAYLGVLRLLREPAQHDLYRLLLSAARRPRPD